jgi:hypothetical protein
MEMSQIAREAKVVPLRISFVMAMRLIEDEFIWCAVGNPEQSWQSLERCGKTRSSLSCRKRENVPKKDRSYLKNPVSRSLKTS